MNLVLPPGAQRELIRAMQAEVSAMYRCAFLPWRWPAYARHWRRYIELRRRLEAKPALPEQDLLVGERILTMTWPAGPDTIWTQEAADSLVGQRAPVSIEGWPSDREGVVLAAKVDPDSDRSSLTVTRRLEEVN